MYSLRFDFISVYIKDVQLFGQEFNAKYQQAF
jgi:hypothetical protein